MQKIGFCFLLYNNLSQHKRWLSFFKNVDPNRYAIYCHPKNASKASKQSLLSGNIIKKIVKTKWADPSLVEATINLFQAAIDDGCDYVILLSGSCIPIHSFEYVWHKLSDGKSVIHFDSCRASEGYFDISETKRRYNESEAIKSFVNFNGFIKSEQWVGLSKKHCNLVLEEGALNYFSDVFASDEHYIPTILNKHNELSSVKNQILTFTDWDNNLDWRHPARYPFITHSIIKKSRSSGALFLRKAGGFCASDSRIKSHGQNSFKIPSDKNYIVFVHIPKNGGCSVKKMLENDSRFLNFSHKTAREIRIDLGNDLWRETFKFAIIRNPWSRVFSAFNFFKKGGFPQFEDHLKAQDIGIYDTTDFNDWVNNNKDNFLNKKFPFSGTAAWMHFKKQIKYYNEPLDLMIKLEDLSKSALLSSLPHENASSSSPYIDVYDQSSIDIVSQAYEEDIIAFGYEFGS
jgi:hypothetical protein